MRSAAYQRHFVTDKSTSQTAMHASLVNAPERDHHHQEGRQPRYQLHALHRRVREAAAVSRFGPVQHISRAAHMTPRPYGLEANLQVREHRNGSYVSSSNWQCQRSLTFAAVDRTLPCGFWCVYLEEPETNTATATTEINTQRGQTSSSMNTIVKQKQQRLTDPLQLPVPNIPQRSPSRDRPAQGCRTDTRMRSGCVR